MIHNAFPQDDYTPYGYLDTPWHSGTAPHGVVRTVPPLGMGIYKRGLPWYGYNALVSTNAYLSLVLPSIYVNGIPFRTVEDFHKAGVRLVSRYHSAKAFSYDFTADGVACSLLWFVNGQDALCCQMCFESAKDAELVVEAAHVYGMNERGWWGSDAATARIRDGRIVAKILAYGDVFTLAGSQPPSEGAVPGTLDELRAWQNGSPFDPHAKSVKLPDPVCSALRWRYSLKANTSEALTVVLTRGVSESTVWKKADEALYDADTVLKAHLDEDDRFWSEAPTLGEGWPDAWKRGWVMDFETLRMNLKPPMGIYKHIWDAMQALNPRVVLGETAIDAWTLGYADGKTARELLLGTFLDAPEPCVPCSREDGSMNMIGEDGSECPTAPMWGLPMRAVRMLLANGGSEEWLREIYPCLKEWLQWWMENRRDDDGWYHCNNSWESGQDGSKRFPVSPDAIKEAANADHVRTVDLESVMTDAMRDMAAYARVLGQKEDERFYTAEYEQGAKRVRSMFAEGMFRDFNANTGEPYIADTHDAMLAMPAATGLATNEQVKGMSAYFDWVRECVEHTERGESLWELYWPMFAMTLTEACVNTRQPELASRLVRALAEGAWRRNDAREHWQCKPMANIPDCFSILMPGVGHETLAADIHHAGCENYGWGCLLPAMVIESVIGLRPADIYGQKLRFQPEIPIGVRKVHRLRIGRYVFDLRLDTRADETIACFNWLNEKRETTVTVKPGQYAVLSPEGAELFSAETDGYEEGSINA